MKVKNLLKELKATWQQAWNTRQVEFQGIEDLNKSEEVWDISMPNNHNFFANGVLAHNCHGITPTIKKIIEDMKEGNPYLRIIGMTATPYRLGDGYIFEIDEKNRAVTETENPYFKKLVYRVTAKYLIDNGFLTPPIVGVPTEHYDTSKLEIKGNKFTDKSLNETFNTDDRLTTAIINEVVAIAEQTNSRGVMIFGATIKHCEEIMKHLPPNEAKLLTGTTPKTERSRIVSDFKAQRLKYVVNVSVLTTGFDAPHVDLIAILRPTESAALYSQIIGRGMRLYDGKENFLILDYAENIDTLFPDGDIFTPSIKSRVKKEGTPIDVTCPQCSTMNQFSHRAGIENYNEYGYEVDLAGNETEVPAHYGRRCGGMEQVSLNEWQRCDYWWTHKECEECGHKNDIAAKYCESCKMELINPNDKLKREFKQIMKDVYQPHTDEVINIHWNKTLSQAGNEMIRADFHLKHRQFTTYFMLGNVSDWLKNKTQRFLDAVKNGLPRTVTYKKLDSGMWEIINYNLETDEERIFNGH